MVTQRQVVILNQVRTI